MRKLRELLGLKRANQSSAKILPRPPKGWHEDSYFIDLDGRLGAIFAGDRHRDEMLSWLNGARSGSQPRPPERRRLLVCVLIDGRWSELLKQDPGYGYPVADIHGERIVLANARSKPELSNVSIYESGNKILEFIAGDAIEHLLIDADNGIWIGYFDEGIYDYGSPSSDGLAHFNRHGNQDFGANSSGRFEVEDCYALNVSRGGVWTTWYSDFSIIHFDVNGQETNYGNVPDMPSDDIEDASAKEIAACDQYLLLHLAYEFDQFILCNVVGCKLKPIQKMDIFELFGVELQRPHFMQGRGNKMHLVQNGTWYSVDLKNLI